SIPKPRDGALGTSTGRSVVQPDFFRTMEIPLRLGRTFTDKDGKRASRVSVVNEAFVRKFLWNTNPIGTFVSFDTGAGRAQEVEIVGVVGDTKFARDVEKPVRPRLYATSLHEDIGRATVEV